MTLAEAKKFLRNAAPGIASQALSVMELRKSVEEELREYRKGENPLTQRQVERFYEFLQKSRS